MAFQVEELSLELFEALVPLMPRIKQRDRSSWTERSEPGAAHQRELEAMGSGEQVLGAQPQLEGGVLPDKRDSGCDIDALRRGITAVVPKVESPFDRAPQSE